MRLGHLSILLSILIALSNFPGFAQQAAPPAIPPNDNPAISGRILDAENGKTIEYANVVLHSSRDSSMVQGTISDPRGRFVLRDIPPGEYYLVIHFIGYEDVTRNNISVRHNGGMIDLGDIRLHLTPIQMEEVEVAADRAPVVYQIDKKVINVDRQLTAASGTAIDVLQNVPSVTVDLDGNVQLRGSGSFTVLIDGRPSTLEGSEALEQIPSSAIENIEIITNPSARYNPEGMAGIINVVMKKNGRLGNSGVVNLTGGLDDKYGGDFLYTLRQPAFSLHFGADYNHRFFGGIEREENRFFNPPAATIVTSDGISNRQGERWSVRGGFELPLSVRDLFTVSLRYGDRSHGHGSELDYRELTLDGSDPLDYISTGNHERGGDFFSGDAEYRHHFDNEKHALAAQFSFRRHNGSETATDQLLELDRSITSGRRSTEDGPGRRMEVKLDYTLPFGENRKFESGYEGRFGRAEDNTSLSDFSLATGEYVLLPEFTRSTLYRRNTNALYALYADTYGALGVQAGFRAEHTDRTVELAGEAQPFDLTRWDYFPSVHTSYSISPTQQFMASYTRRIEHPRGWALEPFETWIDAYNVRRGNPDLKPEYIDSYEAGYQTHLGDNLISAEAYHRTTHNKVEFVRSIYRDNITLRNAENVGTEYSTGVELMLNMDLFRMWDVYLLGNLFDYRIEGIFGGRDFSEQSFTWNVRFNNTFKITPTTMLQVNASYNSPTVSAQGRVEGYVVTDIALRQEFLDRSFAVTLDVSDVLKTAERESTYSGPDFTSYRYMLRDAPVVMLNLRWYINRVKSDRERGDERQQEFGEDDF